MKVKASVFLFKSFFFSVIFGGFCLFFLVSFFFFFFFDCPIGLHCCVQAFSSCGEWGLLSDCSALVIVMVSLVAACRLSCPLACGIFLEKGLNSFHCIDREILNHWTIREVFSMSFDIIACWNSRTVKFLIADIITVILLTSLCIYLSIYSLKYLLAFPKVWRYIHVMYIYLCECHRVTNCPDLGQRDFTGKTTVTWSKLGWLATPVCWICCVYPWHEGIFYIIMLNIYSYIIVWDEFHCYPHNPNKNSRAVAACPRLNSWILPKFEFKPSFVCL